MAERLGLQKDELFAGELKKRRGVVTSFAAGSVLAPKNTDMSPFLPGIFAIVFFFSSIMLLIIMYFTTRHKERLALLEYDRDASVFTKEKQVRRSTLKWGLVLAGAGLGLFLGSVFAEFGLNEDTVTAAFLFMGAGAGLLGYYLLSRKADQDNPLM